MGLLISAVFGGEPALPGLSEGNPVQLKSSPKAKELILLLSGNLWRELANIFQACHSGVSTARQLQS